MCEQVRRRKLHHGNNNGTIINLWWKWGKITIVGIGNINRMEMQNKWTVEGTIKA